MERLKPIELQRLELPKSFRGYNPRVIDPLMQRVIKEIETLLDELKDAKDIANKALSELERYRAQEDTLKEALILAQKTADETRANAHKEAELIIQETRRSARELETKALEETRETRWQLDSLKQQKSQFEKRWRSLIREQIEFLDNNQERSIANIENNAINNQNCIISDRELETQECSPINTVNEL